ncbi:hypothetical protein GF325_01285 [Candidatus Bathyarchaeota archaeon]|nr:hypothetical protein [Candidatus Bathyarchaeota archaeon]
MGGLKGGDPAVLQHRHQGVQPGLARGGTAGQGARARHSASMPAPAAGPPRPSRGKHGAGPGTRVGHPGCAPPRRQLRRDPPSPGGDAGTPGRIPVLPEQGRRAGVPGDSLPRVGGEPISHCRQAGVPAIQPVQRHLPPAGSARYRPGGGAGGV